jgi:hypothetical protein
LCLVRDNEKGTPLSPFLIARTSEAIIKDHSDIWNEKFIGWLFNYVNELGKQHRPRWLDQGAQQARVPRWQNRYDPKFRAPVDEDVSSAAKPAIPAPSIPASLETAAKP